MSIKKKSVKDLLLTALPIFLLGMIALRLLFWYMPNYQVKFGTVYLWPIAVTVFTLIILQNFNAQNKIVWVSVALATWMMVVNIINGDASFEYNLMFCLGILISIGIFFPSAFLSPKDHNRVLTIVGGGYLLLMVGLAALCLYATVTNRLISTPYADTYLGIQSNRLYVFSYHPNEIACAFSIALFLGIVFLSRTKQNSVRILCILSVLLLYIALSLTVTRTMMVITSIGGFMFSFLALEKRISIKRKDIRIILCGIISLILATIMFFGYSQIINTLSFLSKSKTGAEILTHAKADSTQETNAVAVQPTTEPASILKERNLMEQANTLMGRTDIWMAGLNYLKQRPITLLIGSTDAMVSRIPQKFLGANVYHMHDIWIEMLLLGGIPGLLLYLAIIIQTLISSFKIVFSRGIPMYRKYLAIIPFLLMINGITEIYPGLSGNIMDMMFFLLCGTVISDAQAIAATSANQ